jgi:hypothetical protein
MPWIRGFFWDDANVGARQQGRGWCRQARTAADRRDQGGLLKHRAPRRVVPFRTRGSPRWFSAHGPIRT